MENIQERAARAVKGREQLSYKLWLDRLGMGLCGKVLVVRWAAGVASVKK